MVIALLCRVLNLFIVLFGFGSDPEFGAWRNIEETLRLKPGCLFCFGRADYW